MKQCLSTMWSYRPGNFKGLFVFVTTINDKQHIYSISKQLSFLLFDLDEVRF